MTGCERRSQPVIISLMYFYVTSSLLRRELWVSAQTRTSDTGKVGTPDCERLGVPGESCQLAIRRRRWRLRRSVRRSSSLMPPHTPASWFVSKAHSRQCALTSQRRHTALARSTWSSAGPVVPMGKKSSGSSSRHAALWRQSITGARFPWGMVTSGHGKRSEDREGRSPAPFTPTAEAGAKPRAGRRCDGL